MTELEQFKAMMTRAKVVFREDTTGGEISEVDIIIEADPWELEGVNNLGYTSHVTFFHFSNKGKLLKVGIWEK